MMYFQDWIDLQKSPETSLSGVLLTDYVKLWEDPAHKGVYVPFEDDPTTESESWLDLFLDPRDPFVPRRWYRASQRYEEPPDFQNRYFTQASVFRLKRQSSVRLSGTHRILFDSAATLATHPLEGTEHLYAVETEPQNINIWGSIIRQYRHQILQGAEILTRGYIIHFQTDQETIEDPRKRKIAERFAVLAQREDNWDGYDSKKPTEQILEHARTVIDAFVDTIISNGHVLRTPFISTDEAGHITVQWNKKPRELHLHITQQESRYLKVWGPNINTEMEEGILNSDKYIMLWEWLTL